MRAREAQQDLLTDEMIRIADEAGTDKGEVEKAKLRIWTRQWVAAKLAPKSYGDKIAIEDTRPKATCTREEALATLKSSGLSVADIFGALTKPVAPLPVALEIEVAAQGADQDEDEEDLSDLGQSQ